MDCDVLVIGGGAAGCTISYRLSKAGINTALVTSGTPATSMSCGRIKITEENKDLRQFIRQAGESYGLFTEEKEIQAYTNKGTLYQQSFLSDYDDSSQAQAAAGIEGNRDFDPDLAAKISKTLKPYWVKQTDIDETAESLKEIPEDTVIIPPLFDIRHYRSSMKRLEEQSGRKLREAVTPLSLPGKRLTECLLHSAEEAGTKVLEGRKVIDITAQAALVQSGIREQEITYSALVLAGGNLISGGLVLDGNLVREPLLGINVTEVAAGRLKSAELTEALSSGICAHGCRAAAGVYACGSIVAGMSYPLNKGLWDVMLNAWDAAEKVRDAL